MVTGRVDYILRFGTESRNEAAMVVVATDQMGCVGAASGRIFILIDNPLHYLIYSKTVVDFFFQYKSYRPSREAAISEHYDYYESLWARS